MKRMAARDFEDILQCAIPVFEDLVPEPHSTTIMQLLYLLAQWHGFAKLRMHTEDTLEILESLTVKLGACLRNFEAKLVRNLLQENLRSEMESRKRREARESGSNKSLTSSTTVQSAPVRKPKTLNLNTYKLHALGDYVLQIRRFGTTDSFSTQPGELEHRTGKSRYSRTSRKLYITQLARIERRQARICRIVAKNATANIPHESDLMMFIRRTSDDPAAKDFIVKLKAHFLPRVKALHHSPDAMSTTLLAVDYPAPPYDLSTLNQVLFKNDRIYRHNLIRINYTTYDVRRAQDVVNPTTEHRDIMLLSDRDSHRFCYARVLGIYHANVIYSGPGSQDYQPRRLEFLWVRWFELVAPTSQMALDCIRFVPMVDEDAFGFVDPNDVLRSCHLIPRFAEGSSIPTEWPFPEPHKMQTIGNTTTFVDRDMLLRFHWGIGVGHTYSHVPDNPIDPRELQESQSRPYLNISPDLTLNTVATSSADDGDGISKLALTDHELEVAGWDENESDQIEGSASDESMDSDHEAALYEMYHDLGSDAEWLDFDE
ncbi:hypothetical protein BU15DRAFT_76019 [Melanogaster broomeanus]|nr:hypothetical protein BU15DRAFT_76019 [Melanogaster broomeanus]